MSIMKVTVNTDNSAASVANYLSPNATDKAQSERNVSNYFEALAIGARQKNSVTLNTNIVDASGTVTIASTGPTNGQTCTIAGRTFTAMTSGADPEANEFDISATASTVATNLAAAINQSANTNTVVSAEADGAVVTVTAREGSGTVGNNLTFVNVNLSNATFSGSGFLASGSNGTETAI